MILGRPTLVWMWLVRWTSQLFGHYIFITPHNTCIRKIDFRWSGQCSINRYPYLEHVHCTMKQVAIPILSFFIKFDKRLSNFLMPSHQRVIQQTSSEETRIQHAYEPNTCNKRAGTFQASWQQDFKWGRNQGRYGDYFAQHEPWKLLKLIQE